MKVAVMMSTYNGAKYIDESLASIYSQNIDAKIDVYVRDDESSDNSLEIIKKHEEKGLVKLISANNLIEMFKISEAYDYYAILDQDDIWDKDKLKIAVNKLKELKGPAIYGSNGRLIDECSIPLGRNILRCKPEFNVINCLVRTTVCTSSSIVINRQLANIINKKDISKAYEFTGANDAFLTSVCAFIGGIIIYDFEPHFNYRVHSLSGSGFVTLNNGLLKVIKFRWEEIANKNIYPVSESISEISNLFSDISSDENKTIANKIINYRNSLIKKLSLVLTPGLKSATLNKTITIKLKILFGNL